MDRIWYLARSITAYTCMLLPHENLRYFAIYPKIITIYMFIYINSCLFISSNGSLSIIMTIYFDAQIFTDWTHNNSFKLAPGFLWDVLKIPLRTCLLSGAIRCSRLIGCFLCTSCRISHFFRASLFLTAKNIILKTKSWC